MRDATAVAPAPEDLMNMEQRILEELIYERVRASVNLCQLVIFEQDLDKSIQRALGNDDPTGSALTRRYVAAAWRRLEKEWHDMRERLDLLDDGQAL